MPAVSWLRLAHRPDIDDGDYGMLEVMFATTGGTVELIPILVPQLGMLSTVVEVHFSGSSVKSSSGSDEDNTRGPIEESQTIVIVLFYSAAAADRAVCSAEKEGDNFPWT